MNVDSAPNNGDPISGAVARRTPSTNVSDALDGDEPLRRALRETTCDRVVPTGETMTAKTCDDCGEPVPAGEAACPNCGAPPDADSGGGERKISDAAESLRSDQWTTYLVATGAGIVVAGVLVVTIVQQAFLESGDLTERGPSYADSEYGARDYLQSHVLGQTEMKYSKEDGPNFQCEKTEDVEGRDAGTYETEVRCESSDRVIVLSVDIIHGDQSMDWETSIDETRSK